MGQVGVGAVMERATTVPLGIDAAAKAISLAAGRYDLETGYDESALLDAARSGDSESFGLIVERYMPKALAFATRMTGNPDDAQDIVQDAFIKAYDKLGGFRSESGFYTWFYRLLSNTCMDHLRRGSLIKRVFFFAHRDSDDDATSPLDNAADPHPDSSADTGLIRAEASDAIKKALLKLSPRQRAVFLLRHEQGLKTAEVAEALGISEGSVKSHLVRAVTSLKKELSPFDSRVA